MEDALRRHAPEGTPPWERAGPFEQAVEREGGDRRRAALARVRLGAETEAHIIAVCNRECPVSERATGVPSAGACQLYFDAYAVAVWTSAHAEYVASLDAGIVEPAPPTIGTVPCAGSSLDLSDLFARRANPRETGVPKNAESLVQLLGRCTNPGARGWDSVLQEALGEETVRPIVQHAIAVCLTGLHPQLHPARRAPWPQRLIALRVASAAFQDRADVVKSAAHVKEAVRRLLASTMADERAMHAALASLGHPVRHLHQPPSQLPHVGMEAAMDAFARAGAALGETERLSVALKRAFERQADLEGEGGVGIAWEASWLGKGTANVHARQPLVALAGDVWSAAFRAHFIAFWLFAQQHQLRVSRLDEVQHAAIHGLNAATRLVAQLDEATALRVQRLALADPSAGILTIGEVAERLGLAAPPGGTAPNGGARSAEEGAKLLALYGAEEAARLLCYARVAWLSEELLTVDLGPVVAARQLAALQQRYCAATAERLPMHATHVCACTECHRVANACVTTPMSQPFNELGVSSCQIATECLGNTDVPVRLHCAKRSSAALRTALAFEAEMKRKRVEECPIDAEALRRLKEPRRTSAADNGIAARVRRDAKNALEQRPAAVACGEHPMIAVPIVGRVVRLHKAWYALCTYCAALTKVQPHLHRYGAELCCLRCDPAMVAAEAPVAGTGAPTRTGAPACRFCGVAKREGAPVGAWREIKAPLDVAGDNAALPPPLRRVWYCRQHFRGWVAQAHRVLETRFIIAHLVHNAKPLIATEANLHAATAKPAARKKARPKGGRKKK